MISTKVLRVIILVLCCHITCEAKEEEIVESWAVKLGEELWDLGLSATKVQDIKTSYKKLNARVLPTDGESILATIVSNVNKLLKQKMDAVMCLIEEAENLAEVYEYDPTINYTYYNTKEPIIIEYKPQLEEDQVTNVTRYYYKEMELVSDRNFYGIPVNTNYSAVHVPIDVYDRSERVQAGLQWSEGLDDVFIANYESDPTISWQYFASVTGFLRHYPALEWKYEGPVDVYDCRTKFWYIEAATCTKEVVILIDNSGSMTGMRNTIARLTVNTILDTFSNNDFVNIFSFNLTTKAVVDCFPSDTLIQATNENVGTFKDAVNKLEPDDKADFPKAFNAAFTLLEKSRENKTCTDGICNQAVMLITDSVPDNLTQVFEQHNWLDNGTRIPVRVFTYLIGREVTNVREIQYMACLNRGYYVHIQALEEVRSQVIKYIGVMARPLVLQGKIHPLTWSHAFIDSTGVGRSPDPNRKNRIMTFVSGPAFDRLANSNNESLAAELLGIAGTAVLISDIQKLTLPYKIGANGYAFMVTNNGYLMFHPDLRPQYEGHYRDNFNSVDLTEVELLDDDNAEPREPSEEILQLRQSMALHEEGNMLDLKMKFHYDNMKRVGVETRSYYYAPLKNSPFTLGLVLPDSYGNYWIKAGDEIKKSHQMGIPITSFFKGNWRVHPEWVYCDYQRSGEKWFESAEEKLLHFLKRISSGDWKWQEQFPQEEYTEDNKSYNCGRKVVEETEYYCDKELLQLLVFDARSTESSYRTTEWSAKNRREAELVERYGATLRFVATQSGLTRWQQIRPLQEGEEPFGDTDNLALDQVWYKSAVLHHHIDADAFVFSVPFDSGSMENIKVTGSHAIFPRDGGLEAPGSVVGLHIRHSYLLNRFMEITSKANCRECAESCASDELDCYVIDGNGYIVLSETKNDTGKFFGEIEGAVMEAMLSKNIFRPIPMFDYQALCVTQVLVTSGVDILWTPFRYGNIMLKWLFGKMIWWLIESNLWSLAGAESQDYYDGSFEIEDKEEIQEPKAPVYGFQRYTEKYETKAEPCDQGATLYLLQHLSKEGYHSALPVNCSRPFYVKRIPHTNLLLIVVNTLYQSCYRKLSATMEKLEYNNSHSDHLSCQKLNLNSLARGNLSGCFNTHPLEKEIDMCGRSSSLSNTFVLTCISLLCLSNIYNIL